MTTICGVALIGAFGLLLPKPYLVVVLIALSVLGVYEFKEMAKGFHLSFFTVPAIAFLLIGFLSFYLPIQLQYLPFIAFSAVCLWTLYHTNDLKDSMPTLGINLVGLAYLGSAFFSLIGIYLLENPQGEMIGRKLLLFFFAIVWLGDSAAYLLGSSFGKHKIAPSISPKKSWEGFFGNLLGNLIATIGAKLWFFPFLNYKDAVLLAIIVFIFGFFGDLVESSWKRGSGIKDSGTIIPGHGGVLDRVDSIFLTGPVFFAYFYYMFGLQA